MYVYVSLFVHMCAHMQRSEPLFGFSFGHSPPHYNYLTHGLLVNVGLTNSLELAVQQAIGILLFQPPQGWDSKCMTWHHVSTEDQTRFLMLFQ